MAWSTEPWVTYWSVSSKAAAILVHNGVLPADFTTAHAGELADTFRQDAASLRYYAGE